MDTYVVSAIKALAGTAEAHELGYDLVAGTDIADFKNTAQAMYEQSVL